MIRDAGPWEVIVVLLLLCASLKTCIDDYDY